MIYLFNSASRPLYRDNIMQVLAHPSGMLIRHRYRAGGQHQHVDPALVQAVRQRRIRYLPEELERLHGEPERVLLIFVDRYAKKGYTYHPLRQGVMHTVGMRDDRLYFQVQLQKFAAPEASPEAFTESLRALLADKRPPTLVPGRPDSFDDGQYAVLGPTMPSGMLITGEPAWLRTVENLTALRPEGRHVPLVFFRSELHPVDGPRKPGEPIGAGRAGQIPIRKHATYALRVTYRAPGHSELQEPLGSITVDPGPSLQVVGSRSIPIRAEADDITVMMASTRYTEDNFTFVTLRAEAEPSSRGPRSLTAPTLTVPLVLRDPRAYWLMVVAAIAIFALGAVLVGIEATSSWVAGSPLEDGFIRRAVGALGQAGAVFWLFRLTGRKPV